MTRTASFVVTVNLDGIPGTMHTSNSAQEVLQAILKGSINHYNPVVQTFDEADESLREALHENHVNAVTFGHEMKAMQKLTLEKRPNSKIMGILYEVDTEFGGMNIADMFEFDNLSDVIDHTKKKLYDRERVDVIIGNVNFGMYRYHRTEGWILATGRVQPIVDENGQPMDETAPRLDGAIYKAWKYLQKNS